MKKYKRLFTILLLTFLMCSFTIPSLAADYYPFVWGPRLNPNSVSYPYIRLISSSGSTIQGYSLSYDSDTQSYDASDSFDATTNTGAYIQLGDINNSLDFPYAGSSVNYTFVVQVLFSLNLSGRNAFNFLPDDAFFEFIDPNAASSSTSNLAKQYVSNFEAFKFENGSGEGFLAVFDCPSSLANVSTSYLNFLCSGSSTVRGGATVKGWILPSSSGSGGCDASTLIPYLEEIISNTQTTEEYTMAIYDLLESFGRTDFDGNSGLVTDGSAKLDNLLTSEGSLLPEVDNSNMSVSLDPVAHNFTWSLLTSFVNVNTSVAALYITCLTLGIVVLIFNRR